MMADKLFRAWFGLAVLVIGVLALIPSKHLQVPLFDWWDKAQHVLAFAVLTGLGLRAYAAAWRRVLLGLLLYGVLIELAQHLSGWRVGEWPDALADAVGVCLAWCVFRARAEPWGVFVGGLQK